MTQSLMEMATAFVVGQIHAGPCPPDVIQSLLQTTHATLFDLSRREATQMLEGENGAKLPESLESLRQRPLASIQRAQVICLECGKAYRLLSSRHLVLHGLTAKAYKLKWGFRLGQSLSSRSLTLRRRRSARGRDASQYLGLGVPNVVN